MPCSTSAIDGFSPIEIEFPERLSAEALPQLEGVAIDKGIAFGREGIASAEPWAPSELFLDFGSTNRKPNIKSTIGA
ncbi:MAG: hypothetical protein BWX44_01306 [Spirochaetes bacterium ADurb.Bin001]|nr:MAG: hypothetical protein BWX44_01306 [Spirochaetes bacterium ADurb.Bin001]